MASAAPPLPQLCPPPPRCRRCPSLPSAALVGQAPACGRGPWSGEVGVDFSLPAPAPRLVPRPPPPSSASRGGGPRPRPALQLLQGAVPRLPTAWMEVGDHPRASPLSGPRPQGKPLEAPATPLGLSPVRRSSSVGGGASRSDSGPRPLTRSQLSCSQESSTRHIAPPPEVLSHATESHP